MTNENYVQLPSDTSNTGKKVRTNQRVVGANTVEEHFMIIQDPGSNFQAQVISGPTLAVTGLAVYSIQAGSYLIYGAGLGGSESYIKGGSIQTYNPIGIGSVTGQVTIGAGSIEVYQTDFTKLFATISGNIVIGSVSAHVDSVYIQSGNQVEVYSSGLTNISGIVNQGTSPWSVSGIVNIGLGSVRVTNDSFGSVAYIPAGSVQMYGRSGVDIYPLLVTSGTYGILRTDVSQVTSPWVISGTVRADILTSPVPISGVVNIGIGSVNIAGWPGSLAVSNFAALGSSVVVTNFGDLGSSVIVTAGSIRLLSTTGSVGVYSDSALAISGIVNQGTTPWTISGITNMGTAWTGVGSVTGQITLGAGSVQTYNPIGVGSVTGVITIRAGSVEVYDIKPLETEQTRGVFNWSGVSFIGSSTGSNVITPGAGSKLFLKGFTATSDISTKFGLRFSGGTSTFIANYTLPNSGTMITNYIGYEPSGAVDQPIMVNLYSAGSLDISLAVKQSL